MLENEQKNNIPKWAVSNEKNLREELIRTK